MVYWWFVARWFGYLRLPYERDYYLGQTTNLPLVQYASSHPFLFFEENIISFKPPPFRTQRSAFLQDRHSIQRLADPKKKKVARLAAGLSMTSVVYLGFSKKLKQKNCFLMGTHEKDKLSVNLPCSFPPPGKRTRRFFIFIPTWEMIQFD